MTLRERTSAEPDVRPRPARARYTFAAKLESRFEIERESAGVQVAELQVNP